MRALIRGCRGRRFLLPLQKVFSLYVTFCDRKVLRSSEKYQRASNDVGSPEVQVALLTSRINQVMKHFETHPKDRHSRYGLMKMVHARRGLLKTSARPETMNATRR